MKTCCVAALSLMLALRPYSAFTWGPTGHRVVGRIAERHLSEAAARGVAGILGSESLVQASTWPDEIRSDPAWEQAKPWHFVSLDDNESYETAPKSPGGDIVEDLGTLEYLKERITRAHFGDDLRGGGGVGRAASALAADTVCRVRAIRSSVISTRTRCRVCA